MGRGAWLIGSAAAALVAGAPTLACAGGPALRPAISSDSFEVADVRTAMTAGPAHAFGEVGETAQRARLVEMNAAQLEHDVRVARAGMLVAAGLLIGSTLTAALLAVGVLKDRRIRNDLRSANAALSRTNDVLEGALRARTEFLAAASRDIRAPLEGILGMTKAMLLRSQLDRDTRAKIALVHGAGEAMRALVEDIHDIAEIETVGVTLERSAFDLPQLCAEAIALWSERARGKGLALHLDAAEAPQRIVEDPGRMRQILFNLMSNALKFTETGGVTLSVTVEPAGIEDPSDVERLCIAVHDTGVGIPQEKLDALLQSFRERDIRQGPGLGLAISRRLAQAMGGDIFLESEVAGGTSVTLRVPMQRASLSAGANERDETLARCRVLICDANPLTQAAVKASLEPHGRLVEAVGSVAEAASAGRGGRFDVVVVDAAALGEERQGQLAALRRVSGEVAPAAVVLLTPDVGEDEAGRFLDAGARQIIRKPIAASSLADELQAGFASRAMDAGAAADQAKRGLRIANSPARSISA